MTPPRLPNVLRSTGGGISESSLPLRRRKLNKAQVAEQQVRCYELRIAGMTLAAIAAEVDLPISTVERRIKAEADTRVLPLANTLRQMQLDLINRCKVKLDEQVQAGVAVARNSEVLAKLMEREAKLTGIDAPDQIEAVVHQVDQTDMAIAELVREAQAASAVAEAQLKEAPNAG